MHVTEYVQCSHFLQVVERILFLYAKINKGIGYVQVYKPCGCIDYDFIIVFLWGINLY